MIFQDSVTAETVPEHAPDPVLVDPVKKTHKFIDTLKQKSSDVFKTKQIYYALRDDGKLDAKLSQPRCLGYSQTNRQPNKTLNWPLNMEVLPEPVRHINCPPDKREALYVPTGMEPEPQLAKPETGILVYCYQPDVGKYFGSSKVNGNVALQQEPAPNSDLLCFESRFESGNLRKAICTGPNDYQLHLQPDLYTEKYTQWFYFRVTNMRPGRKYRFTIVNMYKATSLFSSGMRPLMYSEKTSKLCGLGWQRIGEDIRYYRTKTSDQLPNNSLSLENSVARKLKASRTAPATEQLRFSLTWTCQFPYLDDVVYFAACYPYTYSQLKEFLEQVELDPSKGRYCQQRVLCKTLAGNDVPFLTITEPASPRKNNNQINESSASNENETDTIKKRCVIITARVHPGETQSSYVVQGLINFLVSDSPDAQLLRSNFVFKIIPMLNPDGVIVGNYRCSLSGCDLNRKYSSDLKRFFPTIWHTKEMVLNTMQDYAVLVYCDLHGHSRKQQMFIYGCKSLDPETRFHGRVFPAMLSKNAPELFDYSKCRFVIQKEKEGTGRVMMWRTGILNSYTLEATFCGKTGEVAEENYHFNTRDFEEMGRQFCDTLLDYCDPDQKKCDYILTELKSNALARRQARHPGELGELSESDLGCSTEDSSDTGSDSSNCDDVPAYYAYVLQKSPKKPIHRKPRKKHKLEPRNTERTTHCSVCQKNAPGNLQLSSPTSENNKHRFRAKPRPKVLANLKVNNSTRIQASGYMSDSALVSSTHTEVSQLPLPGSQGYQTIFLEVPSSISHRDIGDRNDSNTVSSDERKGAYKLKGVPRLVINRSSPRFMAQRNSRDFTLPRIDMIKQAFSRTGRRPSSAPSLEDQSAEIFSQRCGDDQKQRVTFPDISRSNPAETVSRHTGDFVESSDSFGTTMVYQSTDESDPPGTNSVKKNQSGSSVPARLPPLDPRGWSITASIPAGSLGTLDQCQERIRNMATIKVIKLARLTPLWSNSCFQQPQAKPNLQLIGRSINQLPTMPARTKLVCISHKNAKPTNMDSPSVRKRNS